VKTLRRTADIVFPTARVAVFVDGCFWHGCPVHHTVAKTNAEFWSAKVDGNRRRDEETDRMLRSQGWTVIRIWEHIAADEASELVVAAVAVARAALLVRP
jgi:DNA mismatch endonuclease (patch repair protein)